MEDVFLLLHFLLTSFLRVVFQELGPISFGVSQLVRTKTIIYMNEDAGPFLSLCEKLLSFRT